MQRNEFEVLYGGARGGGKSECLLIESLRYVEEPDYKGIIFRRTFPELQDLIDRSRLLFDRVYTGAIWRASESRWTFPSGAMIRFAHMQDEQSKYLYMGQEYQFMGFDELTHFSESQYNFVIGSCRSTNKDIPARVRATSNPGNIGHAWVRRYFVRITEPGKPYTSDVTGQTRCFIPATVYDNPTLTDNDPNYVKRLENLPWREREMMLHGNWDVFEGQAFPEWRYDLHVVKPFSIPHEWTRFIALDWGYSKPFAALWFATDFYDRLYVYKEWYGVAIDEYGEVKADIGIHLSAADVAHGIRQKSEHHKIDYMVVDPSIKAKSGHYMGSIQDEMQNILMNDGITVIPGNNDRMAGKSQVHSRFREAPDGKPNMLIFSNCIHGIRTLPNLPVSDLKPEDVDTKTEDHWYDALRYGCMSHPMSEIVVHTRQGSVARNSIEGFRKGNLYNFEFMKAPHKRLCDNYYN